MPSIQSRSIMEEGVLRSEKKYPPRYLFTEKRKKAISTLRLPLFLMHLCIKRKMLPDYVRNWIICAIHIVHNSPEFACLHQFQ